MSEEVFDVVNEQDRVVDRRPRGEVHRLGLRHRAVHILVINRQGQVFLQKRSWQKDTFPGRWDSSASGHLESGEDYDAAAVRELREELGLDPAHPPERLFKVDACLETGQEFVWVYRLEAEGPFPWNSKEIEAGDWFEPAEVTRWVSEKPEEMASAFRLVWGRVVSGNHLGV